MKRKSLDDLGPLQRTVLDMVWELGEASAHQVRDRLNQTRELAYTTVLSAMQKLEKAHWLTHRTEGRTYIYYATQTRDQAGAKSVKGFLKRVFEGDALAVFQHLIRESDLSSKELTELKQMIRQKEQENQS
ncbi:MAG: BlaI/MecI/CopY family transcriptional regulator [Phycisphaerae bacterium]|nr:BlaI/MecI/CopY family transcriptional regulator [Phycisphaerae bacterium]